MLRVKKTMKIPREKSIPGRAKDNKSRVFKIVFVLLQTNA